jgi:nitrate/nitrite transporter NarK
MVRIPSRRWLYTLSWLALLPIAAVLLEVASVWFTALFVAAGVAMALLAAAINAATPETARGPQEVGPVVGIVAIGRNAGQMVAPAVLAVGLEATGVWTSVTVALVLVSVAGLVSGWLVRVR